MFSVFLRSSSMPASRKRRSVESMLEELANKVDYGFGPKPKTVHSFWKRLKREMPSRSISWNSPRSKRNIPDHLANLGPEDFENELEEMFHPEVEHLHKRTVRETRFEAFGLKSRQTDPPLDPPNPPLGLCNYGDRRQPRQISSTLVKFRPSAEIWVA